MSQLQVALNTYNNAVGTLEKARLVRVTPGPANELDESVSARDARLAVPAVGIAKAEAEVHRTKEELTYLANSIEAHPPSREEFFADMRTLRPEDRGRMLDLGSRVLNLDRRDMILETARTCLIIGETETIAPNVVARRGF